MRPSIHLMVLLLVAAGCGRDGQHGEPDAGEDSTGDPWIPCEECDDRNPCTMGRCNTGMGMCENIPLDLDGDRYPARTAEDGTWCGGEDCDDSDPAVHPGAPEVCLDGVDQDCDDVVDGFGVIGEPVRVSVTDDDVFYPDVVWTGSGFGISWTDLLRSGTGDIIHLSSLSAEGEVTGDVVVVSGAQNSVDLVWTGSRLVLAWRDRMSRLSLTGLFPDGTEDWTRELVLMTGEAQLAWTGSGFGAIWDASSSSAAGHILFTLLDEGGEPVGSDIAVDDDRPELDAYGTLAWTGSGFVAAWQGWDASGYTDVYLRQIGPHGELLTSSMQVTSRGDSYSAPRLAPAGSLHGITGGNFWSGVYLMRAGPHGALAGDPTRISPAGQTAAGHDLLWTGSLFVASWTAGSWDEASPVVVLADTEGEVTSDLVYASPDGTAAAAYWEAGGPIHSMAWTGSEIGLAWSDLRDAAETKDCSTERCDHQLYFTRMGWCE